MTRSRMIEIAVTRVAMREWPYTCRVNGLRPALKCLEDWLCINDPARQWLLRLISVEYFLLAMQFHKMETTE